MAFGKRFPEYPSAFDTLQVYDADPARVTGVISVFSHSALQPLELVLILLHYVSELLVKGILKYSVSSGETVAVLLPAIVVAPAVVSVPIASSFSG